MVNRRGRLGRKNGKGFYDYPDNPAGKKKLWPGLAELFPPVADPDAIDVGELKQRFLVIQALETARCFEEGVLTDVREADVGSILGFGFAPFTGGTLSYIDFMGAANSSRSATGSPSKHRPALQAEPAAARAWRRPARRSTGAFRPRAETRPPDAERSRYLRLRHASQCLAVVVD